jgi:hypothetical protein
VIETKPETLPITIHYDEVSEDEETMDDHQNKEQISPYPIDDVSYQDEIREFNNDNMQDESQGAFARDHVRNETLEDISNDELPEIMKLHFHREQDQLNERTHYRNVLSHNDNEDEEGVHGRNEPPERMEIIPANDTQHPRELLTRNQRKNRRKRLKRYRYEVVRKFYHRFTVRNIKKILIHMNIY